MSEDMKTLLEESENSMQNPIEHEIVKGTVVKVTHDEAFVDIHYKQEIPIPKRELAYPEPKSAEDVVKEGDEIEVYVQSLGGENGGVLSKVKADRMVAWKDVEAIKDSGESLKAKILQVVKGGLVANVNGLRGFIPASQMELHFVKDLDSYVGQEVEAVPLEIDIRKQRLVLSRRKILEQDRAKKQGEIFSTLEPGKIIKGTVKRLVDYGAFVDVGGIDGLVHISDLAWQRVKQPSDVIQVGQEVDVLVKSVDPQNHRISLSIKDTMKDPWLDKSENYHVDDIIEGKIIKLTDFGAFMEIEPGFDGLIPMSELANQRVEKAEDVVQVGEVVKVKIMRIDTARKRISLSISRAQRDAKKAEANEE